jgi:hypothetical protein
MNILLNKRQKLYKKPLSSSEFQTGLSSWDLVRQGQTRDHQWATKEGYLTDKANFDEKRMKQERGAWQSMTGLRTWLC